MEVESAIRDPQSEIERRIAEFGLRIADWCFW